MSKTSSPICCTVCGCSTSVRQCTCGEAAYCGKTCQLQDWKRHKDDCAMVVVKEVEGRGKGLVATRSIRAGTVIFTEDPLIVVAKVGGVTTMGQLENIQEFEKFKKMDKKIRKDFLSLCDPLQFDWRWKLWSLTVGQDFAKFMRIFSVNRTLIGSNTDSDDLAGVYKLLSRINHSCCPNVICQWRAETPLKIEVIAATSIRKGKELTVSYIGDDIFAQQLENWNFQCSCEVCSLSGEERDKNDKVRKFIQNHQIAPLGSVNDLATIRIRLDK